MISAMYVHVPFCKSICAYCDFTRCGYQEQLADKWLCALKSELSTKVIENEITTLYIGGGTPTALSLTQLQQLFDVLAPYMAHAKEVSIEANPEALSEEKITLCQTRGVNRFSLGIQSFQPTLREYIQRQGQKETLFACIDMLHKYGIHNISIDLMYGLPTQTQALWEADLAIACSLAISHISLYALSIEEHSTFGRNQVQAMDQDEEAQMYETAISYLTKHGFEHYEISNFAKAGAHSLHNEQYWHYDDFYGIGCGASGKEHHQRYDNTKNLHTYISKGACPDIIELTIQDEQFEMIMMSLRLHEGVSKQLFYERFSVQLEDVYELALTQEIKKGNLIQSATHVKTTYQGMLHLHDVLLAFL